MLGIGSAKITWSCSFQQRRPQGSEIIVEHRKSMILANIWLSIIFYWQSGFICKNWNYLFFLFHFISQNNSILISITSVGQPSKFFIYHVLWLYLVCENWWDTTQAQCIHQEEDCNLHNTITQYFPPTETKLSKVITISLLFIPPSSWGFTTSPYLWCHRWNRISYKIHSEVKGKCGTGQWIELLSYVSMRQRMELIMPLFIVNQTCHNAILMCTKAPYKMIMVPKLTPPCSSRQTMVLAVLTRNWKLSMFNTAKNSWKVVSKTSWSS